MCHYWMGGEKGKKYCRIIKCKYYRPDDIESNYEMNTALRKHKKTRTKGPNKNENSSETQRNSDEAVDNHSSQNEQE